jgi:RNA polymerase sigma-70 factor (ECF subfamily)
MKKQTTRTLHRVGLSPRAEPAYADMSEIELIESCQHSDQVAFKYLIKGCERNVQGALYRLAPELRDTSDLTQEVFLRLWISIGKLRNPYSFKRWLNQITTNVFYDELRRRRTPTVSIDCMRCQEDGNEGPPLQIEDRSASPDELAEGRELNKVIEQSLARMPEHSRMMIVLRDVDGLSYREIGLITHAGLGTVKSRIARARTKMQGMISPYMTSGELASLKYTA